MIEKLIAHADNVEGAQYGGHWHLEARDLLEEAADEIDRLRSQLAAALDRERRLIDIVIHDCDADVFREAYHAITIAGNLAREALALGEGEGR